MREIIKLQENDIIYEESRRIISKIDTNLMKTQEKFFKQTKTIDEVRTN